MALVPLDMGPLMYNFAIMWRDSCKGLKKLLTHERAPSVLKTLDAPPASIVCCLLRTGASYTDSPGLRLPSCSICTRSSAARHMGTCQKTVCVMRSEPPPGDLSIARSAQCVTQWWSEYTGFDSSLSPVCPYLCLRPSFPPPVSLPLTCRPIFFCLSVPLWSSCPPQSCPPPGTSAHFPATFLSSSSVFAHSFSRARGAGLPTLFRGIVRAGTCFLSSNLPLVRVNEGSDGGGDDTRLFSK
jgi:hypothetical protein